MILLVPICIIFFRATAKAAADKVVAADKANAAKAVAYEAATDKAAVDKTAAATAASAENTVLPYDLVDYIL